MVDFDRQELLGIGLLVLGFTLFTFGVLRNYFVSPEPWAMGLAVVGGLLGFASAGFLVVYYHAMRLVGE